MFNKKSSHVTKSFYKQVKNLTYCQNFSTMVEKERVVLYGKEKY